MIEVLIKGRTIATKHIWFYDDHMSDREQRNNCDLCYIHAAKQVSRKFNLSSQQNSVITDTSISQESIFEKFGKTTKREIRAGEKSCIEIKRYSSRDLLEDHTLLNRFADTYALMFKSKNMDRTLDIDEHLAYIKSNALFCSVALLDGTEIVYHSYVFDDKNARGLFSCSVVKEYADSERKKLMGLANKLLHWSDILYFKEQGVTSYDWGGIESFEKPNGIDTFKMSFGGTPVTYYNVITPCSIKGFVYILIQKITRK